MVIGTGGASGWEGARKDCPHRRQDWPYCSCWLRLAAGANVAGGNGTNNRRLFGQDELLVAGDAQTILLPEVEN